MATRSKIGILNIDGTVDAVYCYNSGHLEHAGHILLKYYNIEENIRRLLEYGDIFYLNNTIDTCKFYARDYRQDLKETKRKKFESVQQFSVFGIDFKKSYTYIFNPVTKQWFCRSSEDISPFF